MSRLALLGPAVLLSACMTVSTGEPATLQGECRSEPLAQFVGQRTTEQLGADIMHASGARLLQWINPDQAVTMDFRADRVRVHLDASGKVESARCG